MIKTKLPKFANEAEEAQWWYDNRNSLARDFVEAARQGKVKRLTLAVLRKRLADSASRVISIRIPEGDLEKARVQAAEAGLPYQTYLKSLLHQALEKKEKRRAS